jgi:alkaline phosphatase D
VPNPRRGAPPLSMLGAAQKAWFCARLRTSPATWKLWGNSVGMLDLRADLQNLPAGLGPPWPVSGYGMAGGEDWTGYRSERREILELVRREKIAGLVTLAGDRHSFQAGLLSAALPPAGFAPAGAEFITGSISAPGLLESAKYNIAKDHPLRALYLRDSSPQGPPQPAIHVTLLHGVRAALALQRTGDLRQAVAERNPDVAPHLSFVDLGGHGYSVVHAGAEELEVEFVCIPSPGERSTAADGGPLAYRVTHRVKRWEPGTAPRLERTAQEGTLPLIV